MRALPRLAVAGMAALAVIPIVAVSPAFALPSGCVLAASTVTCTYSSTGDEQSFTVPAGVTSVNIAAVGGKGGDAVQGGTYAGTSGTGAFGASASGTLPVSPGGHLYLEVGVNGTASGSGGAGGFNGGGNGVGQGGDGGGGGGGASDVRSVSCGSVCDTNDPTSLGSRLLIAGGGGGGGAAFNYNGGNGGSAGATANPGQNGQDDPSFVGSGGRGGGGGTQIAGGSGGAGGATNDTAQPGTDGSLGQGGSAQSQADTQEPGGGAGGGYYGGGGGGAGGRNSDGQVGGGGGGGAGSSFVDGSVTDSNIATDSTGTPVITISYEVAFQPDGWIRKGSKAYVGDDIYNSDGLHQTRVADPLVGARVIFRISIQNDGGATDRFVVHATGAAAAGYRIRYYRESTEITAAVVAGTYTTSSVKPGSRFVIEAWVKATAPVNPSASRLVTITSMTDSSKSDAVKFVVNPQ